MYIEIELHDIITIVHKSRPITYNQHDRSSNHAKNSHIVNGHPNESRVVNLVQLHRPGFVCEKKAKY